MYDGRLSWFHFSPMKDIKVVSSICDKNYSLLHLIFLQFCPKIIWAYMWDFWTHNSFVLMYMPILTSVIHCLDYSIETLEISWCKSSTFVLLCVVFKLNDTYIAVQFFKISWTISAKYLLDINWNCIKSILVCYKLISKQYWIWT